MSETMTSDSWTFFAQQYQARHRFPQESIEWDLVVLKFQTHLYAVNSVVSHLKSWKLSYSKMDV
jgi:hypothetical protein